MRVVLAVAVKELRDGLRDRWVLALTAVFLVFAVGIAFLGGAAAGTLGFQSLAATMASLASLGIFLIPLVALLQSYDAIVGEAERGTLLLLLSYPVSRTAFVLGKFWGAGAGLALATVVGFGLAGAVLGLAGAAPAGELAAAFARFIASALLLGAAFTAMGLLISVRARDKGRAAAMALVLWFVFVLVFDLALLGALVGGGGRMPGRLLGYLLLLNPADVFRVLNLAATEAGAAYAGVASVAVQAGLRPAVLAAALVAWTVLPLAGAVWSFRRRRL
ncbi:ABC transporter permease [Inmirania thermothiophila]|uniref:Cu-processing system permease protein n=1 Tax=Inmirania thermothiophila TaxID=1750597 RepID=A0A3N1Y1J0_9GAMM|nr:ABC transporter permease [Inmirania thermothiophila]ROR32388.1 Cu-processing system permease protein [Inmirania thermothiophila]